MHTVEGVVKHAQPSPLRAAAALCLALAFVLPTGARAAAPEFVPPSAGSPTWLAKNRPPQEKCCILIMTCCLHKPSSPLPCPSMRTIPAGVPRRNQFTTAPVPLGSASRAAIRVEHAGWVSPRVDTLGPWTGWDGSESNSKVVIVGGSTDVAGNTTLAACGWSATGPSSPHRPAWWLARYDSAGTLLGWRKQDVEVPEGEANGGVTEVIAGQRETFVVGWIDSLKTILPYTRPAYFRCISSPNAVCPLGLVTVSALPALCDTCDGAAEAMVGRTGALGVAESDTTIIVGWSEIQAAGYLTLPVFWWGGAGAGLGGSPPGVLPLPSGFVRGAAHAIESVTPLTNTRVVVSGWAANAAGDSIACIWATADGGRHWDVSVRQPVTGKAESSARALTTDRACGSSFSPGTQVATMWETELGSPVPVAYDLNAVTQGLPAGLVLVDATSMIGPDAELRVAGWGTLPNGARVDSVSWVIQRKPAGSLAVGENRFDLIRLDAVPNPTRSEAAISYTLPQAARVSLTLHDVAGRLLATLSDATEAAGAHRQAWNGVGDKGDRLPAGVYLLRLAFDGRSQSTKLVIQR